MAFNEKCLKIRLFANEQLVRIFGLYFAIKGVDLNLSSVPSISTSDSADATGDAVFEHALFLY